MGATINARVQQLEKRACLAPLAPSRARNRTRAQAMQDYSSLLHSEGELINARHKDLANTLVPGRVEYVGAHRKQLIVYLE